VPALFTLIGAELDYHTTLLNPSLHSGQDLAKKGSFHLVGQIEKAAVSFAAAAASRAARKAGVAAAQNRTFVPWFRF